jgi:hypothetical protein
MTVKFGDPQFMPEEQPVETEEASTPEQPADETPATGMAEPATEQAPAVPQLPPEMEEAIRSYLDPVVEELRFYAARIQNKQMQLTCSQDALAQGIIDYSASLKARQQPNGKCHA